MRGVFFREADGINSRRFMDGDTPLRQGRAEAFGMCG